MIKPPSALQSHVAALHKLRSMRAAAMEALTAAPVAGQRLVEGVARLLSSGFPPQPVRIPITNVVSGSDYSARIAIGSGLAVADVILDTGSSALAVCPTVYDGTGDDHLQGTTHSQSVHYGIGGWAGPVVNTSVGFAPGVSLRSTPIALWSVRDMAVFKGATGIMGLAYYGLNATYDLQPYFEKAPIDPATTHPWPFPEQDFATFDTAFRKLRKQYGIHALHVAPYFDDLEKSGVVANRFAFHTLRSWVSKRAGDDAAIARDPLNQGFFVLGGGEEQTDLYEGAFVEVNVLDNLFYNTNLRSVLVEGSTSIAAPPLQAQYVDTYGSNAFIDSGTSVILLPADLYAAVLAALRGLDPAFGAAIDAFGTLSDDNPGLPSSQLDLARWPDIHFTFEGTQGDDVRLTCTPQTYWQLDYPQPGRAFFQVIGPVAGWDANQAIFGLPLLNNYYTVFDRSASATGVIRFAPIRRPEGG